MFTEDFTQINFTNYPIVPRWGHTLTTLNNSLIIVGGYANKQFFSQFISINTLDLDQSFMVTDFLFGRSNHTACVYKDLIVICGGGTLKQGYLEKLNHILLVDERGNILRNYNTDMDPRNGHVAEVVGDTLFVYGGLGESDIHTSNLFILNLESGLSFIINKQTNQFDAIRCSR